MGRAADRQPGPGSARARGVHRAGRHTSGAALDVARVIVRRAERRVVELFHDGLVTNPALQQYLNRLSSLLFVLELSENRAAGTNTTAAGAIKKDLPNEH